MNKKLLVTLTVLAATGCMTLVGCNKGSGNTGGSTITDNVTIARVKTTSLKKPVILGENLDLSNHVEILYSDGSKSNTNFTVEAKDGYIVNGTIIVFYLGGSYDLQIKAERGGSSKVVAFHVDVVTEERLAFETVYKQLDRNYICYFSDDAQGKTYFGKTVHKDDEYFYSHFGDKSDEIIGKLTDNNYYRGTVTEKSNGLEFNFVEFCNWSNEWASSSIQDFFTVDKFVSTFDAEDNETIKFEGESESLVYFFAANTNGFYWYGKKKETVEVIAADPEEMSLALKIYFDGNQNDCLYLYFEDIGSASDEDAEAAVKDPSNVPEKIDGSAVESIMALANTEKNYTVTSTTMVHNAYGQPVENPYAGGTSLASLYMDSSVTKKVFATETQTTDNVTHDVYGIVDHEGAVYNYAKSGDSYPATLIEGSTGSNVWSFDNGSNVVGGALSECTKNPLVYLSKATVEGKDQYKLDTSISWSFLDLLLWSTGNDVLLNLAYNIDYIYRDKGEDISGILGSTFLAIPGESELTFTATAYVAPDVYWTYEVTFDNIGTTVRDAIDYSFGA